MKVRELLGLSGLVPLVTGSSRGLRLAMAGIVIGGGALIASPTLADAPWNFAVSGDSRNCGDVVMPSIAAGARADHAVFYWHLGDLRVINDIDEDFRAQHPRASMGDYLSSAWIDFERNQIEAFGAMPFFLGIGNHETVPPKTREEYLTTFANWLDAPPLREQRLMDDPHDHTLRSYYHWIRDGIDFISLDNATPDQFDAAQIAWLKRVLQSAVHDGLVRALVVGMHEALPESLARGHSMSDDRNMQATGLQVYAALLEVRKTKPVYVLASHSHFVMENVFDTAYWHEHGGVLPGWIVGTAGAVRYALPPDAWRAKLAKTHVYGYLLATVSPPGADDKDPIRFAYKEVTEAAVPGEVAQRFGPELLHFCYQENARN
ncbi:MAG: hypothetical protein ACLPTF_11405 [Steroidobacteraceae bacterium]